MQQTIEHITQKSREQQRFEDFEAQRRLTDELTGASEKLAMVMNNSFEYKLGNDGELYFQGQSLTSVLDKSIVVMEEIVKNQPQFLTELIRNRIERQEGDAVSALARGNDDDPDVLVVQTPIPDAVLNGVDLGAYDKKRKKALVRIWERIEGGVRSTSISLDLSDRDGLQAIARQFGQSIPDDYGSEDILAMRLWGYSAVLHDPIQTVRRRYDEQLERKHGGEWYGGRQDGDVVDALSFIKSQPDIIQSHLARMKEIDGLDLADKKPLYKEAGYNFAAALDRRRYGASQFGDGGDLSGSGEAARAAGIEYVSDCADGTIMGSVTAEAATNSLFGKTDKVFISKACPMCGDKNVTTTISGNVISGSCGCARDICTGEEISVNRRKGQRDAKPQDHKSIRSHISGSGSQQDVISEAEIKKRFGNSARIGKRITIGSASLVAYDYSTGDVVAQL